MARPTALITGASGGIGAELAKLCAAGGYDLVLAARRAEPMQQLAGELARRHAVAARVLTADLAREDAPDEILRALGPQPIDVLINNAGFGVHGPFASTDWDAQRRLLQVNLLALTHLTRLILPRMIERRSGRILNVASTAAFVPGPLMACYFAGKSFVVSFSLALAEELKGSGVTVTVLCPGPTRTGFADAAGLSSTRLFRGPVMSAEAVAREGYAAMLAGRPEIIAGARNRWMIRGTRFAPRTLLAALARRLNSSVQ